jgi:hypothetical protein
VRQFLITKMVCAKCGSNLQLTYDAPKGAGRYADGEPTGADMVQHVVAVEPCEKCMAPLEELRAAARVMVGA